MGTHPPSDHLPELAETLWLERHLLEFLLFKLVEANLILIADDKRFIAPAIGEVDRVMEQIRAMELDRGRVVDRVASDWRVPAEVLTLDYLAANAPPSLGGLFAEHRRGFMELVNEIEQLTVENRRLATINLATIQGTLDLLEGPSGGRTYDAAGRVKPDERSPRRLDEVL